MTTILISLVFFVWADFAEGFYAAVGRDEAKQRAALRLTDYCSPVGAIWTSVNL